MKNIDILVLDTTYILPLFGIEIIELHDFKEISRKIWNKGLDKYKIILPTTCLHESLYKLLNEFIKKNDPNLLLRYSVAIPSILSSEHVELFDPLLSQSASQIAFEIRKSGHSDIMDCLIAATAVVSKAILLSEDRELSRILKTIPETKNIVVWNWKTLLKNLY